MAVDLKRRKSVMARSIRLGHCVCNPRQPCPCETFKRYNVCQCAGERLPLRGGDVALTRYVRKAGCASKIGQGDLLRVLGGLPAVTDSNVLVGAAAGDDAGVYRLGDGRCLVQTVDVFTPSVDDAYLFGQIAAANSVSDCYAMGARPLSALSIVCFPIEDLDGAIMERMLRGGIDKMNEAGCPVIGGHSVNDEEIKCGFAVTGMMDESRVVSRNTARAGDVLVLTKPLGTGMLAFAAQIGRASAGALALAGKWMATLNRDAGELMLEYGAHAATDVTGFGLMGHLVEMVRHSGVSAEIDLSAAPVFAPCVDCLEQGILGGGVERNQEYAMAWVRVEDTANERNLPLLYDPQTSGGMLISLPEDRARELVAEMRRRGHEATAVIGRIVARAAGRSESEVVVMNAGLGHLVGERDGGILDKAHARVAPDESAAAMGAVASCCDVSPSAAAGCCDNPGAAGVGGGDVAADLPNCCEGGSPAMADTVSAEGVGEDATVAFSAFMKKANEPGLIDRRNKKLMAIALSMARHCHPCLKIHMQGALQMGITKGELDEAANLAAAFAGCPSFMLYKEVCAELGLQA